MTEDKEHVVFDGTSVHDMFEIRQSDEKALLSQSIHLAFNALNIKSMAPNAMANQG